MATITRFEDLEIWKLTREFAHEIFLSYSSIEKFGKDFQLKNQINASSRSIMDNIAEGIDKGGRIEFVHFLTIAKASGAEAKSQMYRARDRNYISKQTFDEFYSKTDTVCNKIGSFIKYLNSSNYQGTHFKNITAPTRNPKH